MRETGREADEPREPRADAGKPFDRTAYREQLREQRAAKEGTDASEGPPEDAEPVDVGKAIRESGKEGVRLSELPELRERVRSCVERAREGVQRWDQDDQAYARRWFGSSSPEVRDRLGEVLGRVDGELDRIRMLPFEADEAYEPDDELGETYAYVYPSDGERRVYVGELFAQAGESPPDTQAGILVHEITHFREVGRTKDVAGAYGHEGSQQLAVDDPAAALGTADNFEYFVEEYTGERKAR